MIAEFVFLLLLVLLMPILMWPLYLLVALIRFAFITAYNKIFDINFDTYEMLYSTLLFPLYDGKRLYNTIESYLLHR